MKLKEAIKILIAASARDVVGSGRGISSVPSREIKRDVKEAISRAWLYVYGRKICDNEKFNLGL